MTTTKRRSRQKRLAPLDLDALRRAMKWGEGYQRREPLLKVFPNPMPREGSPEWIEAAIYFVVAAQAASLHLKPWQCVPLQVADDSIIADCYGRRPDEITLRRKMIALGISIYEPDVPAAIAKAERAKTTAK